MKNLLTLLVAMLLCIPAVLAAPSLDITQASFAFSGNPGTTPASQTVTVQNTGDTTLTITFPTFTLTHSTCGAPCSDPTKVFSATNPASQMSSLAAGASDSKSVSIAIPANQRAGTYSGTLTAQRDNDTNIKDTASVTLTVNSDPKATASVPSFTIGQGLGKTATMTITNTGNADLTGVSITLTDLTGPSSTVFSAGNVDFSEESGISVPFGATPKSITVTINVPLTQAVGTYTGTVTVKNSDNSVLDTKTLTVEVRTPSHAVAFLDAITLGSADQKTNQTISKTFRVKNNGDFAETVTLSTNLASKYGAVLTPSSFSLSSGAEQTVTLQISIPRDQTTGDVSIGTATATFNNGQAVTQDIRLQTKSFLSIIDVDVKVAGNSDTNLADGDKISENAKPGDDVSFTVKVENNFDKDLADEDKDIEDVEITVTIEGIDGDDNDDLEESSDTFNLDPEKDNPETLEFTIPDDADDGEYTVVIEVKGEDEDSVDHKQTIELTLEVQREDDDVRIDRAELGLATLQCVRSTTLNVEIANHGSDNQDDVRLTINSQALGISVDVQDIKLDEDPDDSDNDFVRSVPVSVADDFKAGEYDIEVNVYYDSRLKKLAVGETVRLKVAACADGTTSSGASSGSTSSGTTSGSGSTSTSTTTSPGTGSATNPTTGTTGQIPQTVEVPFTSSGVFIALLVAANVVALGGIVALLWKLLV